MQTAAGMKDSDFSGVRTFLASVEETSEAIQNLSRDAVQASALMAPGEAAVLAADIEAISRRVEYLQLVCAGALETHRVIQSFGAERSGGNVFGTECSGADGSVPLDSGAPGSDAEDTGAASQSSSAGSAGAAGWNNTWGQSGCSHELGPVEKVRAEFRTTADYMRCRLRISRAEAQRRLRLAASLLPSTSTSGQTLPPDLPVLAEASASGLVASAASAVIANAVEEIRHRTDTATASTVEADLSSLAIRQDADFLVRAARRWVLLVDQDGAEPTVEELRRFQGVFPGRKKNGLNHLNIYCTDDQHETLLTVMNAAAGPRIQAMSAPGQHGKGSASTGWGGGVMTPEASVVAEGIVAAEGIVGNSPASVAGRDGTSANPATASRLDVRTRPQRLLGGLVDAAKTALATGGVPAAGGLRPQVLVTIDSASLLQTFDYSSLLKPMDGPEPRPNTPAGPETRPVSGSTAGYGQTAGPGHTAEQGNAARPGNFAFSGPVAAATVRRLACDADLLPVVLSGEGRILDIGRAQRLFPPHLRKALHARDGGCAFPGCTIPGPWTEAHHIRSWNHGGPTSTDNGVLLCSHHHHEVHKENWHIDVKSGVPWFVPPAYVDPDRVPLRNTFFRAGLSSGDTRQAPETIRVS